MISIDINKPYPESREVYSHELNKGKILNVNFLENSEVISLSQITVTATLVCNGYLVAEDIACPQDQHLENTINLNVCSTSDYTILPGEMLVEFKLSKGNDLVYPVTAMIINITESIRNNAQVTPESYGTVSEILQEVANARGTYNSLDERLDNIESEVSDILPIGENDIGERAVSERNLDVFLQSFVNSGYVQKIATVSTLSELEAKLYHINPCIYNLVLTGDCATAFGVTSGTRALMVTLGDWNVSVTRFLAIIGKQSEWTQVITISGSNYSYGDWAESPKGLTTSDLPSDFMGEFYSKIAYDSAVITNGSQLNTANYAVPEIELGVKLTSQAAAGFQVESGTIGLLKTVEADGVIKRYMTFPEIEGVKWVQTVNSIAPSWSAGVWTKVDLSNEFDTKIDKPTKCIYFDEDDCVYTLTSGIHTGGPRVGITSVYAPSSVTEIPDRALVSTPDLTTIYIDNASSAVTLGTDIQAAVNNEELIIYYKGQFNVANILATSQKKLNLRLISLEATIGTLNDLIDNQLNLE